jgi:sugar lactone lactonase YvrE
MAFAAGCGGGGGGGDPGVSPPPPVGPPPVANPFGPASVVLGQSRFDQFDEEGGTATPLVAPVGRSAVTSDGKLLAVSNGSVVVFNNYDAVNGPVAESEFSLVHNGSALSAGDISTQGTKVVAAAGHMVLIYNSAPAPGAVDADATAGGELPGCSASELREPGSAYLTPTGRLVVADTFNNRVLIWNNVAEATGALDDADVVLGQPTMNRCIANVVGDGDGDGFVDAPTNQSLRGPTSVWSDGVKLVVADTGNNRVLIWDDIREVVDFQAADHVIGQADFVAAQPNRGQAVPSGATLSSPTSVDVSADGELAVVDTENHRVLIWRAIPQIDGQEALYVVGQSDFAHGAQNDPDQTGQDGTVPSAKTLASPGGVRFDGRKLIVNDTGNHRVLVWRESD